MRHRMALTGGGRRRNDEKEHFPAHARASRASHVHWTLTLRERPKSALSWPPYLDALYYSQDWCMIIFFQTYDIPRWNSKNISPMHKMQRRFLFHKHIVFTLFLNFYFLLSTFLFANVLRNYSVFKEYGYAFCVDARNRGRFAWT